MHRIGSPLVTFLLLGYNQASFIDEAIDGAFAQDYAALEILLSDDASDDDTFTIMQRRAAAYRGQHTVRASRNATRQGIGGHVNTLIQQAKGEILVIAAGDDISMPSRTSRIVDAWNRAGRATRAFHSRYHDMALDGSMIAENIGTAPHVTNAEMLLWNNPVIGATEAWTRDLFEIFGALQPCVTHEDRCMAFRAAMVGDIDFIPEPLVARRRGGLSSVVTGARREARARNARRYLCDISQAIIDLDTAHAKGLISPDRHASLVALASDRLAFESILLPGDSRLKTLQNALAGCARACKRFAYAAYLVLRSLLVR